MKWFQPYRWMNISRQYMESPLISFLREEVEVTSSSLTDCYSPAYSSVCESQSGDQLYPAPSHSYTANNQTSSSSDTNVNLVGMGDENSYNYILFKKIFGRAPNRNDWRKLQESKYSMTEMRTMDAAGEDDPEADPFPPLPSRKVTSPVSKTEDTEKQASEKEESDHTPTDSDLDGDSSRSFWLVAKAHKEEENRLRRNSSSGETLTDKSNMEKVGEQFPYIERPTRRIDVEVLDNAVNVPEGMKMAGGLHPHPPPQYCQLLQGDQHGIMMDQQNAMSMSAATGGGSLRHQWTIPPRVVPTANNTTAPATVTTQAQPQALKDIYTPAFMMGPLPNYPKWSLAEGDGFQLQDSASSSCKYDNSPVQQEARTSPARFSQ